MAHAYTLKSERMREREKGSKNVRYINPNRLPFTTLDLVVGWLIKRCENEIERNREKIERERESTI